VDIDRLFGSMPTPARDRCKVPVFLPFTAALEPPIPPAHPLRIVHPLPGCVCRLEPYGVRPLWDFRLGFFDNRSSTPPPPLQADLDRLFGSMPAQTESDLAAKLVKEMAARAKASSAARSNPSGEEDGAATGGWTGDFDQDWSRFEQRAPPAAAVAHSDGSDVEVESVGDEEDDEEESGVDEDESEEEVRTPVALG
jgi:hypothetical protein